MAPDKDFTILLVPGSWHHKAHMQPLLDLLALNHPTQFCPLPTNSLKASQDPTEIPEYPGAYEDAAAIRSALTELIVGAGRKVLVVCHSYGGMPATEAVTEDLAWEGRKGKGEGGGVIGLFYVASFPLAVGDCTGVRYGRPIPGTAVNPSGMMTIDTPAPLLFNDLPANHNIDVDALIAQLTPQPARVHMDPLRNPGYQFVKCAYLVCEKDTLVPPDMQEALVEDLKNMVAGEVKVVTCQAGHDPWFGEGKVVSDAILGFAEGVLSG